MDILDLKKLRKSSEKASLLLKSIANPDRLLILCQLVGKELCVGDLLKNTHLSQSAFSQHLAVLRKNGLVKTKKESQTVFYSLADQNVIRLLETLHEIYCK